MRKPTIPEVPDGLVYEPDFLGGGEERDLIDEVAAIDFKEVRMHGVIAKRKVMHYGWDYGYESWKIEPTDPLPEFLRPLRERIARRAGLPVDDFEEILVTHYPPGAGIGWHRDAPMFGSPVAGVSLANAAIMKFRRVEEELTFVHEKLLEPRSLYFLSGEVRTRWQHSIPAAKADRYSITFRTLRRKSDRQRS